MKEHRNISIADQIFEQLEREILSGKYRRGEILSELRLSKELDVSRTPIREALLRLEQENIVAESGRGMEVIGISAAAVPASSVSAAPSEAAASSWEASAVCSAVSVSCASA